ncbi:phage portal protein [Jeotgalibaca porci]|uniref:phage portal protein n=1 Tax=Jeotgalibaca porci TaxID=1868793 RepID=UPI00359FFBAA
MTFVFSGDELTAEDLQGFIDLHQAKVPRYLALKKQYESKPPILDMEVKEAWKPDNRLVVNFGRKLIETFNGYFLGIPVKISHDNETINEVIQNYWNHNDMDDTLSELGKLTDLYGVAYLYQYQNENSHTRVIYNSPLDMFIIYDDTIEENPLFAVRYHYNKDNQLEGALITENKYVSFTEVKDKLVFTDESPHYYPTLPVIEFISNEEQQSLIEPVETLINAFNKTLSFKMNDADYFADAYLAVLGAELDEKGTYKIRDNRIINIFGTDDASKIVVEFLNKPDGDTSQEHLLDRLEDLIYQISMIANINDETFGTSSGVALEFKLQPMKNLAASKERKFVRSLNRMFRNFFGLPTNVPNSTRNDWADIQYRFTRNIPRNVQDEAETASKLEGIVSKESQLSVLSIVDNPTKEMERMDKESLPTNLTDAELSTRFGR